MILARHGESDYSVRGLLNGDPAVACGLTAAGADQARALGAALADEPIDVCVTSEFERTRLTAALALEGRGLVPRLSAQLNDPRYGVFEGRPLEEYRAWAHAADSAEPPPGGGESRQAIVRRYAAAFRALAGQPGERGLVVAHSLPLAYALAAAGGQPPRPRAELVEYARPHRFTGAELDGIVAVLERWLAAPDW